MQSPNVNVQFLPAVQLLSLPTLYKYIDFITDVYTVHNKEIKLNWASVNWPYEFNLDFIPKEMIPYLDKCLDSLRKLYIISSTREQQKSVDYFIKSLTKVKDLCIKQNLGMTEETNWATQFKNFFDKLDSRRNTVWWETFPEFAAIKDIK
jgi:hypothetical protein